MHILYIQAKYIHEKACAYKQAFTVRFEKVYNVTVFILIHMQLDLNL